MKQFCNDSQINGADDTDGWLTEREKSDVLQTFLPSDAMRRYLAGAPLTKRQISELVCGAPVPLTDKLRWMEYLAAKENLFPDISSESLSLREQSAADPAARQTVEASFSYQAKQIKLALEELETGAEAVFLLIEAWHDEELDDRKISEGTPFFNADDALEYIRYDMDSAGDDYSNLCWYELQKWKPSTDPVSGKASYVHSYTYYFLKDRACFFEKLEETREPYLFLPESRRYSEDGQHLNLPVPFCAGDIVCVDCRPFQPEHLAVLLEVGGNTDCCCVQALCRGGNGTWTLGALKHGSLFSDRDCFLSPLYRLEAYPKPLPESDCLLQSIQDFIAGDEMRGRLLWERLRRLDTRTDSEIRLVLAD